MAVGLKEPEKILPVSGVRVAACSAGIYPESRPDIALLAFEHGANCAALFTRNAFSAAPVQIARNHLQIASAKYCLVNAGCANAGTGKQGYDDAIRVCNRLAEMARCPVESVLPFSTGVIGEYLPVEKICDVIPALYSGLGEDNWPDCARAIMTTDTIPKAVSRKIPIADRSITITGIAKGAGMIRPDMATMLAFIATDAAIDRELLGSVLTQAVEESFNRICVDGDTSTNDACVLVATGKSDASLLKAADTEEFDLVKDAVTDVFLHLAQSIVRDGEGASKFITVEVQAGASSDECLKVAYAVAGSPLVKTAFYAADPNWGRILAAIGRSGLVDLAIANISIYLNDVCIVDQGMRAQDYSEDAGKAAMSKDEIFLRISLGRGTVQETVWTCDLSHEYVSINAEYRT
ncbi:MAG: bifunctional glutamate N-acetyltransferase/amino-acid acetyltransferase ArgJ [Gammaproteobacteria bacterium]